MRILSCKNVQDTSKIYAYCSDTYSITYTYFTLCHIQGTARETDFLNQTQRVNETSQPD